MNREFIEEFIVLMSGCYENAYEHVDGLFVDETFISDSTVKYFMNLARLHRPNSVKFDHDMIEASYEKDGWILSIHFREAMTVFFVDGNEHSECMFLYGNGRDEKMLNYYDIFERDQEELCNSIKNVKRIYA